jgi:enoyl-[acyl-carrier-protein] reductase (NADH)
VDAQVAFVAGVADSSGYGWAIAKALAEAGARITVGTWPPVMKLFQMGLSVRNYTGLLARMCLVHTGADEEAQENIVHTLISSYMYACAGWQVR